MMRKGNVDVAQVRAGGVLWPRNLSHLDLLQSYVPTGPGVCQDILLYSSPQDYQVPSYLPQEIYIYFIYFTY